MVKRTAKDKKVESSLMHVGVTFYSCARSLRGSLLELQRVNFFLVREYAGRQVGKVPGGSYGIG
jgi:hypothetical protein